MTAAEDAVTGGGDSRNAVGGVVGRDLVVRQIGIVRERPELVLSEDGIRDRIATYVPAGNHDAIRKMLELYRFVGLTGPAGAGVETTAVAALGRLVPAARVRRHSTEQDGVDEAVQLEPGGGYIVRAGEAEPSRMRSFLSAVRASRGFTVIIGTAAEQKRFAELPAPITVEPPPAEEVYRSHLLHRDVDPRWLDRPLAGDLLEGASPSDASRLARLVHEISAEGGGEQEVEYAYRGRGEHLRAWFGTHREPMERALVIAEAVLGGTGESRVHQAALSLAARWEGPEAARTPDATPEGPWETGPDVSSRPECADFVLEHVCAESSPVRSDVLDWLGDLPSAFLPEGEAEDAHRAVRLFARLAGRCGEPERIIRKAAEWADGPGHGAALAYVALSEACLDPVVGGRVRSALDAWSRRSRTPQTLKLVAARVCQVIGQTYLPAALTRLMHLATHGDERVRREAAEVAGELAEQDASTVFTTALRWIRSTCDLSPEEGASRLDAAMCVLLGLLPSFGQDGPREVLEAIDQVVLRGHPRLRPHLLGHARALAGEHPLPVLAFALDQSGAPDSPLPRQTFGSGLLLSLIASAPLEDLPALLTDGIDPLDAVTAWAFALESPAGFPDFTEALSRWLDLAETHPDLIDTLYAAAWHSRETRRLLSDLVTRWSDARPGRRHVKEAVLVHVLLPEWRRGLLVARIRLRGLLAGRRE